MRRGLPCSRTTGSNARIRFDWKEGEQTHFADIVARGVRPPDLSKDRADGGLGWPATRYCPTFPGQRHILKWPTFFDRGGRQRITILDPFGRPPDLWTRRNDWEMGYTTEPIPQVPAPPRPKFARVACQGLAWPPLDPSARGRTGPISDERSSCVEHRRTILQLVVDPCECEAPRTSTAETGNVRGEDTLLLG